MMNEQIDDRFSVRLGTTIRHGVFGLVLSALLGAIGGGILAGGFWLFGLIVGLMCAAPVGLVMGCIIGLLNRPSQMVVVACFCQLCGAMILGFGFGDSNLGGRDDWANYGQITGAIVGIVVAAFWPVGPRLRPNQCRECGYDLHGNVSGVCPECGTTIAEDQLDLIREPSSPRWSDEEDEGITR